MGMSKARVKQLREQVIEELTQRTHALLLHAKGTAGCPSYAKVREGVALCLDASGREEYADLEYFQGPGFILHIDRKASPWPTVTTYVAATTDGQFLIREATDG